MPAGGMPSERGPSQEEPALFLNNYRGGGIGDFGATLFEQLQAAGVGIELEETRIDGRGLLGQMRQVRRRGGPVIANLGLTAWGRSGPRNYLGFSSVGRRARAGRPTIAVAHHAIEMFEASETGYPVSRLVRWGAHRALAALRSCDLVVFAPRLRDLLVGSYGARSVWLTPMPSGSPRPRGPPTGPWKIVTAGYLAPYKGIDTYLGVAERLRGDADFSLVGRPHAVLSRRPEFAERTRGWMDRARSLGVATPGFLDPLELDRALSGRTIGLLPYTSASGASASIGLFVERGVPVVTSDLPEFQYLADEGAGIVVTTGREDALSFAVRELTESPTRWAELVEKQLAFARAHSWGRFVGEMVQRYPALTVAK
jgi:glycosyltransferase involved in cell wall biosynthesis